MRSRTYGSFDHATLRQAMAGPGMDSRQWTSMGVVDPDEGSQRAVSYDPDFGPLVHVTLQPSGIPVVCRVGSVCAGSGEADGEAFSAGDEVVVVVPEGDERTGPVIVARTNNTISPYPMRVAGIDVANNVSFKRRIGPIAYESNTAIIFRVASVESFFSLSQDGNATLSSGDKSFLHIGSDFLGMQTGDAEMVLQANQNTKEWHIESQDGTNSTIMRIGGSSPGVYSSQPFTIATQGQQPWQHLVTLEQFIAILATVLGGLGSTPLLPLLPLHNSRLPQRGIGPGNGAARYPRALGNARPGNDPGDFQLLLSSPTFIQNAEVGATGLATGIVAS